MPIVIELKQKADRLYSHSKKQYQRVTRATNDGTEGEKGGMIAEEEAISTHTLANAERAFALYGSTTTIEAHPVLPLKRHSTIAGSLTRFPSLRKSPKTKRHSMPTPLVTRTFSTTSTASAGGASAFEGVVPNCLLASIPDMEGPRSKRTSAQTTTPT